MRIGVDLLWVRPGKCGGTESVARNLLDGFAQYDSKNEYILFVTTDNAESFRAYEAYTHMRLLICPTVCESQRKRLVWENLHLDGFAKKNGVDVMFVPVYSKPHTHGSKIPYVCVIHDLQALHFPEYFSKARCVFMKYMWKYTCKTSAKVITISDYCKEDLISGFPVVRDKIKTIYNPIVSVDSKLDFDALAKKYGIQKKEYYYCVSSLLPHKNLDVILRMLAQLKKENKAATLVLSGVGGQQEAFEARIRELDIEDRIIQTGFISNEERDCLYENCKVFLFPSIFEGFGMPPIEAMRKGCPVVMTRKSCLEEVTCSKAIYVEDPTDAMEWARKLEQAEGQPEIRQPFPQYSLETVTKQYIEVLTS